MDHTLEELEEHFSLFDDWEERYRYLIDLGRSLPHMDDSLKIDKHLVRGCTSRVWLIATSEESGAFRFVADSDAHIVRGLIYLLLAAYDGQTKETIQEIDIHSFFKTVGLDQNLSPNRRNGFYAMVERIEGLTSTR